MTSASLSDEDRPEANRRSTRARRALSVLGLAAGVAAVSLLGVAPANAAPSGGTLARIKACESGGSYRAVNSSSGASGAYQFLDTTWRTVPAARGYTTAASAPASVQDQAARQLYAREGSRPWTASVGCWGSGSVPRSTSTTPLRAGSNTTRSTERTYRSGPGPGHARRVATENERADTERADASAYRATHRSTSQHRAQSDQESRGQAEQDGEH